MNRLQTDFLCARMTPLTGAGTLMAIFGNYYEYNRSQTENEADGLAIFSDWSNVGADLQFAINRFKAGDKQHQLEFDLVSR
jgi:hypothetical protein